VGFAEDAPLHQTKLFPGGELPRTGIAREAGQMEDLVPGTPNPVVLRDEVTTLGAAGAKYSGQNIKLVDGFFTTKKSGHFLKLYSYSLKIIFGSLQKRALKGKHFKNCRRKTGHF
jgi:hypothetical protein